MRKSVTSGHRVENVQQCRRVPEQEMVRENNLVKYPVCNDIQVEEVIYMQCKEMLKVKDGMNLNNPVNRFPRTKLG